MDQKFTLQRRDFLRISGMTMAGAVLSSCQGLKDLFNGDDTPEIAPDMLPTEGSPQEKSLDDLNTPLEEAVAQPPLFDLEPPVLLPSKNSFKTWKPTLQFSRTYYVDGAAPNASDQNPGTLEAPFKTIQRAADVLEPGQCVVVAAGIYRETVRPRHGGISPEQMISYQAAPGAEVILSGSIFLQGPWAPSEMVSGAWALPLPQADLAEYNPFALANFSTEQRQVQTWVDPNKMPALGLARGLVFQNGRRLQQIFPDQVSKAQPGNYWISGDGLLLHLIPLDKQNPTADQFEIAVRESVFRPERVGIGYLHVSGFTMEHVANGFPWPQIGALSTNRGHHWLIENNTIRQVNSVGMDIGAQYVNWPQPAIRSGSHIVRKNTISECGICGIQALSCIDNLIEDNTLSLNAFHPVESYWENGAIKTHNTTRTLIRRNVISDTLHGSGIWLDFEAEDSRVCQNLLLNGHTVLGAIILEASTRPNLYDHNFIWQNEGNGFHELDCREQIVSHNFVAYCSGRAVHLAGKVTKRLIYGSQVIPGEHTVTNNILYRNGKNITSYDKQRDLSNNLTKNVVASFKFASYALKWYVKKKPARYPAPAMVTHDFFNSPRGSGKQNPGLVLRVYTTARTIKLRG